MLLFRVQHYDCERKRMRKLEDHMFEPLHSVIVSNKIRREYIYVGESQYLRPRDWGDSLISYC